jgi:hypothetical protein
MREPTSSASVSFQFQRGVWLTRDCCSNMLALVPDGEQPRSRIVGPKLSYMDERIATTDLVISKLVRCTFSAFRPVGSSQRLTLFTVEKAIPEDELYH